MTDSTGDRSQQTAQDTYVRSLLVAGMCLISFSLGAYEISPASVTPIIRTSMGISSTDAGLLVSVMFGTAVVASLPVGAILDRTNSRTAIVVAVVALLVAGLWGWIAADNGEYYSLLASRIVGGITYVIVWNAGIDIVKEAVTQSQRATVVGVFTASGPLGFVLGQGASPAIANRFGWPIIFIAYSSLSLVGLVLFLPSSRGFGTTGAAPPTISEFAGVLRDRNVWLVGGLGFIGYSLYLFVNSWAPSYINEIVGLPLGVSGILVALFPAIGALSRTSGGVLSDRLFHGNRRPVMLFSFCASAPLVIGFTQFDSVAALVGVLLGVGFAVQLALGISFTYVGELVSSRVTATAVAFQTSVSFAGGFVAPIAGGAIIETHGYAVAFAVAGILAVVGITFAWVAPETAT